MMDFEYETTEQLYEGIEKAIKNGRGPEAFTIGFVDGRIAQTWDEVLQADKDNESIYHTSESDPKLYTGILQTLEWKPIETAPINEDYPFLISTPEVDDGVVEVLYDEEMGGFIDEYGDSYVKAMHWMQKPKPPHKKQEYKHDE